MLRQKTLLTFDQLKAAFEPFGLPVEETRGDSHSSAVKIVHDGVPYTIDCYHDLTQVPTCAAKFYILLERHHADIKRLYEAWKPLCDKEMHVMSGGGLQLQAFFSTPGRYQGILYLSLIDDGRFQEIEKLLGEHGVPFTPYSPTPTSSKARTPWYWKTPNGRASCPWLKTSTCVVGTRASSTRRPKFRSHLPVPRIRTATRCLEDKKMGSGPRNRSPQRATTPFAPHYPTNGY